MNLVDCVERSPVNGKLCFKGTDISLEDYILWLKATAKPNDFIKEFSSEIKAEYLLTVQASLLDASFKWADMIIK